MSREIFYKYGLIIATLIAGFTVPTSIISFMREPVINNNYDQDYNTYNNQTYYYYYNNTYYGDNATGIDYSKPLEQKEYYNLDRYDCVIRNFTISNDFAYWYYWNSNISFQLQFWVARGFFYETIVALNGTLECYQFLNTVNVYQSSTTSTGSSSFYNTPFLSDWLFIFMMDQASIWVNLTITDEILL